MTRTIINLLRDELVLDIRNRASAIAKAATASSENPLHDDSWLIDIFQDGTDGAGNNEINTRQLDVAVGIVTNMVNAMFSNPSIANMYVSDEYVEPDSYYINLESKVEWKPQTIILLKNLMHELIVYRVLFDWCLMVSPANFDALKVKIDDLESRLKKLISVNCPQERPIGFFEDPTSIVWT